jgi:hypothetical protein
MPYRYVLIVGGRHKGETRVKTWSYAVSFESDSLPVDTHRGEIETDDVEGPFDADYAGL